MSAKVITSISILLCVLFFVSNQSYACPPPDTTPPTPNPMEWTIEPYANGTTSVSMKAALASDPSGGIEYYFDETSGNSGGNDSGWQSSRIYVDNGLSSDLTYTYRVYARDFYGNTTSPSASKSATPDPNWDSDYDNLPDGWETQFSLDPNDANDADTDLDSDGYKNLCEYLHDTDPNDDTSKPDNSSYIITIYVPANVNTIQRAIWATISGDTIEVSQGTYYEVVDFNGVSCTLTGADPNDWEVVADTVIDANDPNGYVITFENSEDTNSILTGFTITGGNLGIYCDGSSPVISNCLITDNNSTNGGAGMYNVNSSPAVTNCFFVNNDANYGGGVYDINSSSTFTSCVFAGNTASEDGGAIYDVNSSPLLINCTFSGNSAVGDGGGMYSCGTSEPNVINCIFWDNQADSDGNEIYNADSADPNFRFCDIEGCGGSSSWDPNFGSDDGNNIDIDPNFADTNDFAGPDGVFGTYDDGLGFWIDSPCVDAADGNAAPETDITGTGRVDISDVNDTGTGDPNYADIGAYESPMVWFVDADADGNDDGTSWEDAFNDLQDALGAASSGDEIWVAEGTYKPGNSRSDTFQLVGNVGVYGGFDGTESSKGGRNPNLSVNITTLSGDIGVVDDTDDNCYHVVTGANDIILDRFTITDGNANGSGSNEYGGGMYNYDLACITINDCLFTTNKASGDGGGIYIRHVGEITVSGCTFTSNEAGSEGGGMYKEMISQSTVTGCTFANNECGDTGGGMYTNNVLGTISDCIFSKNSAYSSSGGLEFFESYLTVSNCVISENSSDNRAGGMTITNCEGVEDVTLSNCIFWGNTASTHAGGLLITDDSMPTLTNCTFTGNTAGTYGGGMANYEYSDPLVTNCIFWDNSAVTAGNEIYTEANCDPTFSYCDIEDCGGSGGGWDEDLGNDDGGNIDSDPCFANESDPAGLDGYFGTLDDGLRLWRTSPCTDAADGDAAPSTDILGLGRLDVNDVNNTGTGSPDYSDMGAYEAGYDSDSDGMPDGWEIRYGLNPTADWDVNWDLDNDGLTNLQEYNTGTNPNDSDTDNDGMPDGWENTYGLDPTDASDETGDQDSDTYSNVVEFVHGSDPNDPNSLSSAVTIYVPIKVDTIQSAIDWSLDGDIIIVLQGTYYESINFDGKAVTLTGTDADDWTVVEATIIDADDANQVVLFESSEDVNSVLAGLTLTGGQYGIYCSNSLDLTITNCIIEDNNSHGMYCASGTPLITNNKIELNVGDGIYVADANSAPVIKNNWIYDNENGVTFVDANSAAIVRNNTIADNNSNGIYIGSVTEPNISNCILWYNDGNDLYGCSATYSCIEDVNDANGTGNITSDPNFVDPNNDDYHLDSNSPCINTGDPNADPNYAGEIDIDAGQRVRGARVDIGADEMPPVWYVDCDSNGAGTGASWADAFTTITAALSAADGDSSDSDTIIVAEGTYYESIDFAGKALTLQSTDPEDSNIVAATIIDANDPNTDVVTFNSGEDTSSVLEGFTITGGYVGIYCANDSSPTINRCDVNNNADYGVYCNSGSPTITYCTISDNNNYGLRYSSSSAGSISNCIIADNDGGIIGGWPSIINCSVVSNEGYGILNSSGTIKNCIIWGNTSDLYNSSVTYSCIEDSNSGQGNIDYMPYFTDANGGNYHLLSYSPCIDTGDPNSDYSDEPNDPNNTCINMGAYGDTPEAALACADSESDGLPDTWELLYWPSVDTNDANDDPDADNLNNLQEYHIGLDPNDSDSDNDGIPDDWEIDNGLDPHDGSDGSLDADGDGLTNAQEYSAGTDMNDSDSDDDGMTDGWEVTNGLNPTDANDADSDLDGDNYSNGTEFAHGSDPNDPNSLSGPNTIVVPADVSTIQLAIDWSIDGDVIMVLEGIYSESIDFNGKAITLTGTDPNDWLVVEATIIDANDANQVMLFESFEDVNSVLTGLTLTGGQYGIYCSNSIDPVITRCIVEDNNSHGINCVLGSPLITNNMLGLNDGDGIYVLDANSVPIIKNNWIYDNENGIAFVDANSAVIVRNNTIADNDSNGIYVGSANEPNISNCILWDNDGNDLYGCSATYSCIEDVNDANGTGNITSDPKFIDDTNYDYRLLRTSPCKDAGDPNGTYTGETDIEGQVRNANGVDMGADEICEVHNTTQNIWYNSIQGAIDDANTNDVVKAYEWTFYESIDFNGTNVTLMSTDPNDWDVAECTIIDVNDSNLSVVTYDSGEDANSVLAGFTITGGNYGVYCDSNSSPIIKRCIIEDNNSHGLYCVSAWPVIINNKIGGNSGSGIYSSSATPPTIKYNFIYENGSGIEFVGATSAALVLNNTIADNESAGIYKVSGTDPNINSCILWYHDTNDLIGCSALYSCIEDVNDTNGSGNITDDPLLENDYHLKPGSPCIISGDPNVERSGDEDIDGQSVEVAEDPAGADLTTRYYVNARTMNEVKDGESWATAYKDLQSALTNLSLRDEIWVAGCGTENDGIYTPAPQASIDRTATFQLVHNVDLYGGFPYQDDNWGWDDRDPEQYITVLSGDFKKDDTGNMDDPTRNNNSYHVVTVGNSAVLDGFTITGGYAEIPGINGLMESGGGIYFCPVGSNKTLTVESCIIEDNYALHGGGGICSLASTLELTDCFIQNNIVSGGGKSQGGGAFIGGNATLTNCVFSENKAKDSYYNGGLGGGCFLVDSSSRSLLNCVFDDNYAQSHGGAVLNNGSDNTQFINCVFYDNKVGNDPEIDFLYDADSYGGAVYNFGASPSLINCTLANNSADSDTSYKGYGGAMYNEDCGGDYSCPSVTNCILWDNVADTNSEIYNDVYSDPTFSYCDIKGSGGSDSWASGFGSDGGNNIDSDPLFAIDVDPDVTTPEGPDNQWGTIDDGLQPDSTSECIDSGDDSAAEGVPTDIKGEGRFNGQVDRGAYEYYYRLPDGTIPTIIYVDEHVDDGLDDGSSWEDAYDDFQEALDELKDLIGEGTDVSGYEVWVANGTYYPSKPSPQNGHTFQLIENVPIYGGFAGGETSPGRRNWVENETILSGDVYDYLPDPWWGDAYIVVQDAEGATIDGFIIQHAGVQAVEIDNTSFTIRNCTVAETPLSGGYGIYVDTGLSPVISNCTIEDHPYGIYNWSGSPTITDCNFEDCSVGLLSPNGGSPTISGCTFSENRFGLIIRGSSAAVSDCNISNSSEGGARFHDFSGTISECCFSGNTHSGLLITESDVITVKNCKIYNTKASSSATVTGCGMSVGCNLHARIWGCMIYGNDGHGIVSADPSQTGNYVDIINCTIVDNGNPNYGGATWGIYDGAAKLYNSIVYNNGNTGGGNFGPLVWNEPVMPEDMKNNCYSSPGFEDYAGGDYHLGSSSPCIDTGSNDLVPEDLEFDIDGDDRKLDGPDPDTDKEVDKGADEVKL